MITVIFWNVTTRSLVEIYLLFHNPTASIFRVAFLPKDKFSFFLRKVREHVVDYVGSHNILHSQRSKKLKPIFVLFTSIMS
jgi:hypothetical protein